MQRVDPSQRNVFGMLQTGPAITGIDRTHRSGGVNHQNRALARFSGALDSRPGDGQGDQQENHDLQHQQPSPTQTLEWRVGPHVFNRLSPQTLTGHGRSSATELQEPKQQQRR